MFSIKKILQVKTKFGVFDCLFDSNAPEKGFTVTVPKLRGIVTFGDNIAEAKKMVKEAIELHCDCLFNAGLAEIRLRKNIRKEELIGV